jgi:hypothetical protein
VVPPVEVPEVVLLAPLSPPMPVPLVEAVPVPELAPVVPLPDVLEALLLTLPLDEAPVLPESDGFPLPEELLAREATGMFWSTQAATSAATVKVASASRNLSTASNLPIPSASPSNVQSIIPPAVLPTPRHARRAGIA